MRLANEKCFLDTNLLIYALDPREPEKRRIAADLLRTAIKKDTLTLSPQSLSETYHVLTRVRRGDPALASHHEAESFIRVLQPYCRAPMDGGTIATALKLRVGLNFGWFDSLLLTSAIGAGCKFFLSEDMQHERMIANMTIINPFKTDAALLIGR
jgi:predicted nucleic acid-binding protein